MSPAINVMIGFLRSFTVEPLYRTGWGEPISQSGALTAETSEEMTRALVYLAGYSDACRLACPYMSRSWQIAQHMGIVARRFTIAIDDGQDAARVIALVTTYRAEILDMLSRDEDGMPRAKTIGGRS